MTEHPDEIEFDEVQIFTDLDSGLIDIVQGDVNNDLLRVINGISIYGKCLAGDHCAKVHAVIFEPRTFNHLVLKYITEVMHPDAADALMDQVDEYWDGVENLKDT